jgi:hypothetical protein
VSLGARVLEKYSTTSKSCTVVLVGAPPFGTKLDSTLGKEVLPRSDIIGTAALSHVQGQALHVENLLRMLGHHAATLLSGRNPTKHQQRTSYKGDRTEPDGRWKATPRLETWEVYQ